MNESQMTIGSDYHAGVDPTGWPVAPSGIVQDGVLTVQTPGHIPDAALTHRGTGNQRIDGV
jgi:hypothetical protein